MDNISQHLSDELSKAFNKIYQTDFTLTVNFNGRSKMDYTYGAFNSVQKKLSTNGVTIHKGEVFKQLIENLSYLKTDFDINYNDRYLYFNLTKIKMENSLKDLFKNGISCIACDKTPKKILVDFSSPNIAKNMYVGHLRSTIIGDSICRLFESMGNNVMRVNHIGDFGLPFGMLITSLKDEETDMDEVDIDDLQEFYKKSKERFDSDPEFKERSHKCLVKLQNGDPDTCLYWEYLKNISRKSYNDIYQRLNIQLDECGESFYQPYLKKVVGELSQGGLIEESEGMKIIHCPTNPPLIVQKSNGGYTYDTTDLAAIWYRLTVLKVEHIYYVVDIGQSSHFNNLFYAAKKMGWLTTQTVSHIGFGLVQGDTNYWFNWHNWVNWEEKRDSTSAPKYV